MGKLQLFMISFSNGQGIYHTGQIVEGNVTIDLSDAMNMRGVRIRFHGEGHVKFTKTSSAPAGQTGSREERRTYIRNETYLDMEILLAGRCKNHDLSWENGSHGEERSGNDIQLTAGRHTFPFALQLPPHLPSSYEGEHGYVRYSVFGTIDKPWKFDHVTTVRFTVVSLLDLNLDPKAAMPGEGSNSKEFCCLCCASGPVNVKLSIDRRGYVPGEAIPIRAEVENRSNRKMISNSVVLIMSTTFHAGMEDNREFATVASLVHGEILQGDTDHWEGEQLIVPPVPASYLSGCNIIDIRYDLELRVSPTGLGFDLTVPLEIVIGNVPLQHGTLQRPPMPPLQQIPTQAPHMLQHMPVQHQSLPQMQSMPVQHQPMPQTQQMPPMPHPQHIPLQHQSLPPEVSQSSTDVAPGEKAPMTSQPQVNDNDTHL